MNHDKRIADAAEAAADHECRRAEAFATERLCAAIGESICRAHGEAATVAGLLGVLERRIHGGDKDALAHAASLAWVPDTLRRTREKVGCGEGSLARIGVGVPDGAD